MTQGLKGLVKGPDLRIAMDRDNGGHHADGVQ